MKSKTNVSPNQIFPKFKIGDIVYSNNHLGEFTITHIYFKDKVILYKVVTYLSNFLLMYNELSDKPILIITHIIEEERLKLID